MLLQLLPIAVLLLLGLMQQALSDDVLPEGSPARRFVRPAIYCLMVVSAGFAAWNVLDAKRAQIAAASAEPHGIILPANEPRPRHDCGDIPEDALALFFGDGVAWTEVSDRRIPLFSVGDQTIVELSLSPAGADFSALVFRRDGRSFAIVDRNRFALNPHNYFEIVSQDRHELRVRDQDGREVLHARFVNERTFVVNGIFAVAPDREVVVSPNAIMIDGKQPVRGLCLANNTIGNAIFGF